MKGRLKAIDDFGHFKTKVSFNPIYLTANDSRHLFSDVEGDNLVSKRGSMPVKSYLVHPAEGKKDEVLGALVREKGCEIIPAENKDVIVLVTDTTSKQEEKALEEKLAQLPHIHNLVLVAGFADDKIKS